VNAARSAARRRGREGELRDDERPVRFDDAAIARLDVALALGALPLALREPVVLHYLDGLTSAEIGAALGMPAATIRFRLMLARRRLALLLGDRPAPRAEYAR
jgi:RNA polymerase sigma-70 factor (ECF subfamily)